MLLPDLPLRTLNPLKGDLTTHAASWALEEGAVGLSKAVVLEALAENGAVRSGYPVLWFGVPADGSMSSLLSLLTETDRRQIRCFRDKNDRWSVAAARAAVRILLSQCLDCPVMDVALIREERGKPVLDLRRHGAIARDLHFSISHSKELIAVALARSRIGIDIEAMHPFPELVQVAKSLFAPEMQDDIMATESDATRIALFYRFWTLGEAFIKATGEGISQGLRSFAFSANGKPVLTRVDGFWGPRNRWCFGTSLYGKIRS